MKTRFTIAALMAILIVALSVSGLIAAPGRQSEPVAVTTARAANLREGPGVSYPIAGTAKAGASLNITGCNADCSWYKTDADSWIAGFLLVNPPKDLADVTGAEAAPPAAASTSTPEPTATVQPSGAQAASAGNLRSGPGTNFDRVGAATKGQALEIVGQSENGDWLQLATGEWIAAFLVRNAPQDLPIVPAVDVEAPPTAAPEAATAPATAAAPAGSSGLQVEFVNPHYDCVQGEQGSGDTAVWGYRRFQVDMFIRNDGTEPVSPPWEPTRWFITDGVTDSISDANWQWLSRGSGTFYPQPTIQPGSGAGWTFIAFPVDRNQWVKAVEFVYKDEVFRQEFDLGPYGNAHNYKDCGEPRRH